MRGRVETTGRGRVRFADQPPLEEECADDEVEGPTLVSLVSPGTESQIIAGDDETPRGSGYAAVFRIERLGAEVEGFDVGDLAFCFGTHAGIQRFPASEVHRVPDGLAPEVAVFARLMGVSWTTLVTAVARPPARVLVTGLGIVGNLAAQLFDAAGYVVTAVDPVESRRRIASACGLPDVRDATPDVPFERFADPLSGAFALGVECSGHEAAVLDAARAVRYGGEVVLVGVPWQRRTDIPVHDLLDVVFHHFVTVRSGWEWALPRHRRPFDGMSVDEAYVGAMEWLRQGRVRTAGLARVEDPRNAERVYRELNAGEELTVLFDWREP